MQSIIGMWRRFTKFLIGSMDDDDYWRDEAEYEDVYDDSQDYEDDDAHLSSAARYDRGERRSERNSERAKRSGSNVVDFDSKRGALDQTIVRIIRPEEMHDATLVCDYLRDSVICIIDMQEAEKGTAQRIADYLGGVSYALMGTIERIDSHTFIMAPDGVKIDSELKEELKSGGLFKSFR